MSVLLFCLILVVALVVIYALSKLIEVRAELAAIELGESPITMAMATHYEHAKFRIRYVNLCVGDHLYDLGLRNGQYGIVVRHRTGLFAKTTVDNTCRFISINEINFVKS